MKIGVYDSGLGGVTILKALAKALPGYDYQYYGDTANLPYGDKTEEEIYELVREASRWLFEAGCLIVIFACNTASAATLRKLQDDWLAKHYPDRKLLGVIIPTIEYLRDLDSKKVIVLATQRTVESKKYEQELEKFENAHLELLSVATPELVPLIEEGKMDEAADVALMKIKAVSEVREFDTVLLGCTHYTLLKERLVNEWGSEVQVIAQDKILPSKLSSYLEKHRDLEMKLTRGCSRQIHLTKNSSQYDKTVANLLDGVYQPMGDE